MSPSLINTPLITNKETHLHFPDEPSIELDVGANLVLSNSNHDLFMMNFKCSSNDQSQIHWIECKIAIILKSQLCHVNSVYYYFLYFIEVLLTDWFWIFISCLSLTILYAHNNDNSVADRTKHTYLHPIIAKFVTNIVSCHLRCVFFLMFLIFQINNKQINKVKHFVCG